LLFAVQVGVISTASAAGRNVKSAPESRCQQRQFNRNLVLVPAKAQRLRMPSWVVGSCKSGVTLWTPARIGDTGACEPSAIDWQFDRTSDERGSWKRQWRPYVSLMPPLYQLVRMSYQWFQGLPPDIQSAIMAATTKMNVSTGDRLYAKGEYSNGLFTVVSGAIRVSGVSPTGRAIILDFYGPGCWFGDVSTFDDLPRVHDAEAVTASTVLVLRPAQIEVLTSTHPAVGRALLRLVALHLRILLVALEDYSLQSYEQRLAARLLMLTSGFGKKSSDGVVIDLALPQEVLAQLIGSTRQRVNQILSDWRDDGIVRSNKRRILVANVAKLKDLAEG